MGGWNQLCSPENVSIPALMLKDMKDIQYKGIVLIRIIDTLDLSIFYNYIGVQYDQRNII